MELSSHLLLISVSSYCSTLYSLGVFNTQIFHDLCFICFKITIIWNREIRRNKIDNSCDDMRDIENSMANKVMLPLI